MGLLPTLVLYKLVRAEDTQRGKNSNERKFLKKGDHADKTERERETNTEQRDLKKRNEIRQKSVFLFVVFMFSTSFADINSF
jgi:hypothetical protein